MNVLSTLPDIDVSMSVKGWWAGGAGREQERRVPLLLPGRRQDSDWITVHADQEYVLNVRLARRNKIKVEAAMTADLLGFFFILCMCVSVPKMHTTNT